MMCSVTLVVSTGVEEEHSLLQLKDNNICTFEITSWSLIVGRATSMYICHPCCCFCWWWWFCWTFLSNKMNDPLLLFLSSGVGRLLFTYSRLSAWFLFLYILQVAFWQSIEFFKLQDATDCQKATWRMYSTETMQAFCQFECIDCLWLRLVSLLLI